MVRDTGIGDDRGRRYAPARARASASAASGCRGLLPREGPFLIMDSDRAVIRQVTFRILPLVWIIVFFAALDRSNLWFAALQMNKDIGLGAEAFGFGAGLFFIPYALFAVPSNLMLQKLRARIWIPVLMASWGLVSSAMAFIDGHATFFVLRFLLGVTEAGVNPAAFYLLSLGFPSQHR